MAKTSNRFVAACGVLLMTSSLAAFAYAPSIEYTYLAYGVGYGMLKLFSWEEKVAELS